MSRAPERILALSVALLLATWCLREDVQPDLYFHLAAGRHMWEAGALPDRNVFLAVHGDHPFRNHEWLVQALAWPLFAAGGAPLLTFIKTVVAGGCLAALAGACSPHGRVVRWAVLVPAVLVLGPRLVLRPEVLSFLGVALVLWRLQHDRFRPTRRSVLLLAAAQVVWSNSHGVSLLGPVVVGLALAGALAHAGLRRAGRAGWLPASAGDPRRLALLLAALLGAALINPYGPRASFYAVLHVLGGERGDLSSHIVELTSPFAPAARGRWEVLVALAWASLVPPLWLAAARARRARLEDAAIAAGLLALASPYVRNLPLVALGAAVPTAAGLGALAARAPARARAAGTAVAIVAALLLGRATLADRFHENADHDVRAGLGLGDFLAYEAAASFLSTSPPRLLFNTFGSGHHLTWAGLRPFISGNIDLYPPEHLRRYHGIMDGTLPWERELDALGVTDVLLDHRVEVPVFLDAILAHPAWALVHADDHAVVLRRRGPGVVELPRSAVVAAADLPRRDEEPDRFGPTRALRALRLLPAWRPRGIARMHLARLLERLGARQAAVEQARKAYAMAPDFGPIVLGRAELERAWGDADDAVRLYGEAARLMPRTAGPWVGRAQLSLQRGDVRAMLGQARMARTWDPGSAVATQLLLTALELNQDPVELRRALAGSQVRPALRHHFEGVAARLEQDLARAEACFLQALALEPGLEPALGRLAAVRNDRGDLPGAEEALGRLVGVAPRDPVAWRDLGTIRGARGRLEGPDGALAAWRRAAEVGPREVVALVSAARVLAERRPAEARGLVVEALRRNPKHPDALRLGRQLGVTQED